MTTASWKSKFTFLTPNCVSHTIGEKEYKFYPISVGLAFKLRSVAKPLTKALTTLLGDTKEDTGSIQRVVANAQGTSDQEIVIEPISADLARLRHEQRQKAVEELVEALTAEANLEIVGDILVDSLREDFPPGDKSNPTGKQFMAEITLPNVPDLLIGVAKANKGVFGPLVSKVGAMMSGLKAQVEARVLERTAPTAVSGASQVAEKAGTTTPAG